MSVDLLTTAHPGHIDGEIELNEISHMESGGDHTDLEEQDLGGIDFDGDELVTEDRHDPPGLDLEGTQPEEHENEGGNDSTEGIPPDDAEEGFYMESSVAVFEHVKPDSLSSAKIPEVEIMLGTNGTTADRNTGSTPVASLTPGSNMQQEDAMSEIDYDHNDDDSADIGTANQKLSVGVQGARDENPGEESESADITEFMAVANGQKKASQTDSEQGAPQETTPSVAFQEKSETHDYEHDDSELVETADFTGIDDAEAEEPNVSNPDNVDILNDQSTDAPELIAIEPSEDDNEYHEDTDYMDVTELDQSPDDFSNPPTVQVHYRGTSYALFQRSYEDEPDSFFFSDMEALEFPLSQFLASLREVVEDVANDDEVLIRIDELGLEFAETTDKKLLDKITFRNLVDLHDRLVRADDPDSQHHTMQIFLVTRPNCQRRLEALLDGANVGEGLDAYRLSYPEYLTVDFPAKSTGSADSLSRQDEESNVELDHYEEQYEEQEDEELDVLDASHNLDDQAPEDQVLAVEDLVTGLQPISDGQVTDEKDQSASVTSDHAITHGLETVDTEDDKVDDEGVESYLDISERQMGDSGTPGHFHEGEDQETFEVEDQIATDANHQVLAPQDSDPKALVEENEEDVDDHTAIDMEEHISSDVTASLFQPTNDAEHNANPSYEDGGEEAAPTMEEAVELGGLPELAEADIEVTIAESTHIVEADHHDWQDQENAEDYTVADIHESSNIPHHKPDERPAGDESEQTSASGTLAGDEIEGIDTEDIAAPVETHGNVDGSSIQHDADEIDWEDNGDETAIGGTHLSTPASNTGKRGRVDDGDEAGGEHDVKRHRV
ncbi:hypothetical protein MGG_05675 [Pyricularia oryzae 70-15]|uniref:Uncharacterized protein n=1 Tax=Pyricularia oryzae (strain 70-15 / ATCC MYA-4617 / FGSC 8958) TaxID=242507 RepID=G4MP13_PYRO7|nr:uncharacterized protein MGG_05675 [Pyricularia oryzae 70-15]EHA57962.1 hypothetical protein MGG_05675 [Pyricularia oryzae 70-15]KAI7924429.1 hypothetical protein M9X92_003874 [Pyricularia oryzae]KAI7931349.1 hypothetical protein M0657_001303 [Pyricularia oryzae]